MKATIIGKYISRVNKVQDYINSHLDQNLSLGELACVARFSEFHFHRIFSSITNEPLYKYIQRLRLEKAANQLLGNGNKSITEIALDCGFSDSASFARSFKKHYGTSASAYRNKISKNRQMNSKNGKAIADKDRYNADNGNIPYFVDVQNMKEMTVIYMRYTGPYRNNPKSYKRLVSKLMRWADARDLLSVEDLKLFSIYHDNPEITDDIRQRTSFCLSVPEHTLVGGEVGKMVISSGKYAIGHFELQANQFEDAWNIMFGHWLPGSGYQADDLSCFEMYLNNPDDHPQKKALVEIYLPVKPL